jgi:tetratricopeptide (TPR) repeat protein
MQRQEKQDSDRLGRLTIQIMASVGGLAGLFIAALELLASLIGLSSSHTGGWGELSLIGGVAFLLLSLAGIAGAIHYPKNRRRAAWLFISCGIVGFFVGYIAWITWVGILGWVLWLPSGVLLIAAGLLALITPERLRSRLLGQEGMAAERAPIDQAVFVGTVLAGIGLLFVILLFSGILVFGVEDALKDDDARDREDFANADLAASMGRWDKSVESYDDILARNQSNHRAWQEGGNALQHLGRYDEANESYQKALELNPGP